MSELTSWAPLFAVVVSLASLLYSIFNSRSKDNEERFRKIDVKIEQKASSGELESAKAKLDAAEKRITVVENDIRHLPDKDSAHRLELSVAEMRTEMRGLSERIKPIAAMADRVQEALLERFTS